ncbi:MAG: hypothetical protein ACK4IS_13245 [Erythrobacter sp.]
MSRLARRIALLERFGSAVNTALVALAVPLMIIAIVQAGQP